MVPQNGQVVSSDVGAESEGPELKARGVSRGGGGGGGCLLGLLEELLLRGVILRRLLEGLLAGLLRGCIRTSSSGWRGHVPLWTLSWPLLLGLATALRGSLDGDPVPLVLVLQEGVYEVQIFLQLVFIQGPGGSCIERKNV